jgi:hypothetical protein
MWTAIKSDLFEFMLTVQEDTQDTISKVVDINSSRTAEDEEKITEDERILSEFRNNLSTYSQVCLLFGQNIIFQPLVVSWFDQYIHKKCRMWKLSNYRNLRNL